MAKCYAADLIAVAKKEVGYLEKASNKNLNSKTANAGSNNYTKYANYFDTKFTNFYNGIKNGFPWCDVFVDWCFIQAFGKTRGRDLLCQPLKSAGAGCPYSVNYYKSKDQFYTKNPQVGDQIFFYDSIRRNIIHTGLVYKVDDEKVYTIEGNTSSNEGVVDNGGAVAKKSYALSYHRIAGYGRPKYDIKPKQESTPKKVKKYSGLFPSVPKNSSLKNGDTGTQVKRLQKFLNWYGNYGLEVDGQFGKETEKAVKKFQQSEGLEMDGKFGNQSLNKAKSVKK